MNKQELFLQKDFTIKELLSYIRDNKDYEVVLYIDEDFLREFIDKYQNQFTKEEILEFFDYISVYSLINVLAEIYERNFKITEDLLDTYSNNDYVFSSLIEHSKFSLNVYWNIFKKHIDGIYHLEYDLIGELIDKIDSLIQ